MPHQIDKTALVMHSAERMFHLVNDIARYPEFLPWCAGAEIHERQPEQVTASLEIAKGGVRHTLTTRNQLLMPEAIEMNLVDGPFRNLTGRWHFKSLEERYGTKVASRAREMFNYVELLGSDRRN